MLPSSHFASRSASPAPASSSTLQPYYSHNESLPWPSGSHINPKPSPALPGYVPPAYYVSGAQYPSPSSSSAQSPRPDQSQLCSLLCAQPAPRTSELTVGSSLRWDVRDMPTEAVVLSGRESEHFCEHPASVTYATSPPVPFILVACNDALPWLIPVHAQPASAGVTVGDILQAVHVVLHTPIEESMPWLLPTDDDRTRLYHAYWERISRSGNDRRGILAVDWLGEKTLFLCLARDEALAKRRVADKNMWPYVYVLELKSHKSTPSSDT